MVIGGAAGVWPGSAGAAEPELGERLAVGREVARRARLGLVGW